MGAQLTIHNALVAQLKADATLIAFLANGASSIFDGFERQQTTNDQNPNIFVELKSTKEPEGYIGVPKQKTFVMEYDIHGLANNVSDAIELDEKIKNAIETDLSITSSASHTNLWTDEFINLSQGFRKTIIKLEIESKRITAGSR